MNADEKKAAREELTRLHGIDFTRDFHTLRFAQLEALAEKAKAVKYRRPKNANGSPGRYFFFHLIRGQTGLTAPEESNR